MSADATFRRFRRNTAPSGLLLHVTSLPSRYGIGDVGPAAFAWIDRLCDAGQSWWQALPLGPTGYGNSPYQALSSFAGNWLLVSPEWLIEDGLLRASDCQRLLVPQARYVDYDAVIAFQTPAARNSLAQFQRAVRAPICGRPMSSSAMTRRTGWRTTRFSAL